ncbi:axoneme-associated protein mst101(2)-like [Helicoverpa zea]|uniref:axoneme-associated protein mst101(2)-like n=1 Tax=Helicoverpa zea TaxID=7113 RepID=UPI001F56658A|nr:axoneme-associated protein mst101(2)-like [Helicoverpa zea]
MHPEKLGFEDCDLNSIFKAIDKDTQTIEANSVKSSESSVKSYKLPLPRELEKPEDGTIKVFSFCQVIQDPDCPKLVTIVRESVTEEVHKHNESPNSDAVSNRYRYCKEVIKPYLKDYPPDCPDSGELLLRDAIITANEEFPEYPPCYEVPVNESDIQPEHKTKQEGKYIPPIQSKKSDKPLCPPVQPPACIQPKPDLDCTKKTSHKDLKPKQSKKDLIPAKKSNTSKQSSTSKKSNTSKKSSTSKKSDHKSTKIADCVAEKAALRKAEKCLAEKALAAKCCEKKLAQKECTCPAKKSDKDLSKKCEKKSSKDSCKKKSDKDLCLKPSDKNIAKQGCTCDKNSDKDKPHLILCPGQKVPKICIEITDPKCCPEIPQPAFCEDEDKRRHQDEACQEDLFPPENCAPEVVEECNCGGSPKDDDCPEKPGKEKSSKSNPKASWPPSIGKKDHTNKKDGSPEKKDCLGCLLESLRRISSDAESCKRKAEKCAELKKKLSSEKKPCPPPTKPPSKPPDSPKRKMGDCPSENPPLNCKPKAKAPCPSTPIDVCSPKERKSSQKGGSKVGEERSKKGAGGSTSARKVDESVKGNLVQVQAEERQLGSCTCTTNAEVKSAIDAHHKTLATLKCAMEDFMCKMYRTTQEAVTVITTESAKQLQKIKKSASKSSDECRPPKKVCDTRSKNNLRRFSIVNIDNPNPDTLKKLPDCVPPVGHDRGPLKYFDAVVSKVDSAASMISDTLAFDMPKPLKPRTFNDCSSEYDVPNTTRPYPSDITNVLESEGTSSMFASWRDKLWAMFIEDENKPEVEIASKQSGSITSESDEDLLHKLID